MNTSLYRDFQICISVPLIYLIQQSPQFASASWSNESRKNLINFKHTKHAKFIEHAST